MLEQRLLLWLPLAGKTKEKELFKYANGIICLFNTFWNIFVFSEI